MIPSAKGSPCTSPFFIGRILPRTVPSASCPAPPAGARRGVAVQADLTSANVGPRLQAGTAAALEQSRAELIIKIDGSSVQCALDVLRDKPLVWKSAHGLYAIEDAQQVA